MARQPTTGSQPRIAPRDNWSGYSDADIDHIIAVAGGLPPGRRGKLRLLLYGRTPPMLQLVRKRVSEAKIFDLERVAGEMSSIEGAARRLLTALQVDNDGDIESMPMHLRVRCGPIEWGADGQPVGGWIDWSIPNEDVLRDSIKGVVRLHGWAHENREALERLAKHQSAKYWKRVGRPADDFLNYLFEVLGKIWTAVFERETTTSIGPFSKFIKACLEPAGINLTDDQIRKRARAIFRPRAETGRER